MIIAPGDAYKEHPEMSMSLRVLEYDWETLGSGLAEEDSPLEILKGQKRDERLSKEWREEEIMNLYSGANAFMDRISFTDPDISHKGELVSIIKKIDHMNSYPEFPRYKSILTNTIYRANAILRQIRTKERAEHGKLPGFG